jgi:drug/metabolite transporter (DMT)-like permease
MGIIFGLLAALTYGASDFAGGLASRRARAITVVVVSQLTALVILAAALPLVWGSGPTASALRWGALAGLAGGAGVTLLYRGLAIGRMSVVAPVTAVLAAALPVLIGLFAGERPSAAATLGVAAALVAIVLVSSAAEAPVEGPEAARPRVLARPGLLEALGSGTGFGLFFALLGQAGDAAAVWPLLAAKGTSLALLLVLAAGRRASLRPPPGSLALMLTAGALDIAANASFVLAARASLLSLASVLTSLYPATTILCARLFLHERLTATQRLGLVVAAAGVVLITLG